MAQEEEEEEEDLDKSANWSEIPHDLLHIIMDKLVTSSNPGCFMCNYFHIGCVCVSWSCAIHHYNPQPPPPFPFLMVPSCLKSKKGRRTRTKLRSFYNISDNKINDRQFQVRMPRYRHCCGSSHGWLITVDEDDKKTFSVRLLNPFLSYPSSSSYSSSFGRNNSNINTQMMEIRLPSLWDFALKSGPPTLDDLLNHTYLRKAVLSANPISNPTDYTVMAIYSGCAKLAFSKPGHKSWTPVKLPRISEGRRKGKFVDVIYYQGKFLAIDQAGVVVVCDIIDHVATARVLLRRPPEIKQIKFSNCRYLVESSKGNLLQIHRRLKLDVDPYERSLSYLTVGFKVFKLSIVQDHLTRDKEDEVGCGLPVPEDSYEWVEVKSLCGDMMFLGRNASICILPNSYVYPGCKPNHIYYTDDIFPPDQQEGPHDMGVCNLEDGTFVRHFPINANSSSLGSGSTAPIWPAPIWIQPSVFKRNTPPSHPTESSRKKSNSNSNNINNIVCSLFSGEDLRLLVFHLILVNSTN